MFVRCNSRKYTYSNNREVMFKLMGDFLFSFCMFPHAAFAAVSYPKGASEIWMQPKSVSSHWNPILIQVSLNIF